MEIYFPLTRPWGKGWIEAPLNKLVRSNRPKKFNRGKTLKHARPLKKKNRRKRGIYYCPKNKTIQSKLKNRNN